MGARNFVRQAFFIQKAPVIWKVLCPLRLFVSLAGVGHEVPAPASCFKNGLLPAGRALNRLQLFT